MGYNTHYQLSYTWEKKPTNKEEAYLEKELCKEDEYSYAPLGDFLCYSNACKWYDHDLDMKELSLKFPKILFKLEGLGEEYGDMWHKYYKNGKMQLCEARIEYDEYDPSKLKKI